MKDLEKELQTTRNSLYNLAKAIIIYINYKNKLARVEYYKIENRLYEMAYRIKVKIENELHDNKR